MRYRAILPLLLTLVGHSPLAAGEPATGGGLVTPVRPPMQGFATLFQSPPPSAARQGGPIPASASLVPAFVPPPARPAPGLLGGTASPGATCRAAITAAEQRYGIPTGLLLAIGVVESGRRDDATGARQPWPWTINAEGEGRYFDSKAQAVAWARAAQAGGVRSIDTGCMQVNLKHHPDAFPSLEQAFDPVANADYAARFLRELREGPAGGNWMRAVGFYHSQTPELADPYRQQVQAALGGGGGSAGQFAQVASAALAAPSLPSSLAGMAGERTFRQAAPPGPVGRGLDAYRAAPVLLVSRSVPVLLTARRFGPHQGF
jgi:hypothetical protein